MSVTDYVDQALNGGLVLQTMIVLCVVKLVATVVSYCSGNAGGIFAPSLFHRSDGRRRGRHDREQCRPFSHWRAWCLRAGWHGCAFRGIIRAPLTSVFMIFEITQDYQILVPLMVANLLSFAISRRYQPVPVYEALLHQDQIHLPSGALRESAGWTARDIMNSDALSFLAPGQSVDEAWEATGPDRRLAYLVGTRASIRGIVTPERLSELRAAGRGSETVRSTLDETFVHVHPDHSLDVVLVRFAQGAGLLPVVGRTALRVEGVITIDEDHAVRQAGKVPAIVDHIRRQRLNPPVRLRRFVDAPSVSGVSPKRCLLRCFVEDQLCVAAHSRRPRREASRRRPGAGDIVNGFPLSLRHLHVIDIPANELMKFFRSAGVVVVGLCPLMSVSMLSSMNADALSSVSAYPMPVPPLLASMIGMSIAGTRRRCASRDAPGRRPWRRRWCASARSSTGQSGHDRCRGSSGR